jgi:high frequency lysogenization protein
LESHNRTLALAGVFQAAGLVRQLAHEGRADTEAFRASVHSILKLEADDTETIFGGISGVRAGLAFVRDKLPNPGEAIEVEIARYVVSLLHLSAQLARRPAMQERIREGIETIDKQMAFFANESDDVHSALIEKLAELYVQTLSTITPRIIVNGEHGYLVNPAVAARVRASLLAGVRAGFLWRQLGGRRWHLLFARRRIVADAAELLAQQRQP